VRAPPRAKGRTPVVLRTAQKKQFMCRLCALLTYFTVTALDVVWGTPKTSEEV
jgi:hypothetical protein